MRNLKTCKSKEDGLDKGLKQFINIETVVPCPLGKGIAKKQKDAIEHCGQNLTALQRIKCILKAVLAAILVKFTFQIT